MPVVKHQSPGRLFVNAVALSSNCYALRGCLSQLPELGFGSIFQFLTILSLFVSTLAFAINVLRVCFSSGLLDVLFDAVANIAVPVEALVSVLYWPMVLTAREMLVPKDSPFDLPLSLDLALHLWPTLFIWFDFLVYNTTFKRSSTHVTALYIFAMLYYVWTAYCFHRNGFWPYPFLGEFSHAGRAVLYMACGTLAVIMYNGGALIHSKIHKVKKTAGKKIK